MVLAAAANRRRMSIILRRLRGPFTEAARGEKNFDGQRRLPLILGQFGGILFVAFV
jgi:hypothetical protein